MVYSGALQEDDGVHDEVKKYTLEIIMIEGTFNTNPAPHFGGLHEARIKSVKNILSSSKFIRDYYRTFCNTENVSCIGDCDI